MQIIQEELKSACRHLGTLGGGNHFIEVQRGDDGHIWLMIHSGSRNFGYKTAEFFHEKALTQLNRTRVNLPDRDLAFLPIESRDGEDYYSAMRYCCDFALANRALMMRNISEILAEMTGAQVLQEINITTITPLRNSFWAQGASFIVREPPAPRSIRPVSSPVQWGRTAISSKAWVMQRVLSHARTAPAGVWGGAKLKGRLSLTDEQQKMRGIVHGLRSKSGLDEAPGAYKDIDQVMKNQVDLVQILITLKPLGSIKG